LIAASSHYETSMGDAGKGAAAAIGCLLVLLLLGVIFWALVLLNHAGVGL
jgi:hypothetical protein